MTTRGTGPDKPSFSLVDHNGTPVTEQTYRGNWTLVFFGFTHWKVVCPRVLGKLSAVLDELGETAGELRPLYITVDPDRDTPQALRDFLRAYPRFAGLAGSADAIERVKGEFRVFARRRDDPDALAAAEITAGIRAFVAGGSSSGNPAESSGPRRVIPEAYR
ncbi:SCO family protein [Streptomyces sp. R39]|uniref:SCO family protein n=1 Tax=Streptomyces sp. R39 TaxID=3238631 RepID=A0AB39R072_9ACTN